MSIMVAPDNVVLKITEIKADDATKKHLQTLGLIINSNVIVLSKNGGNVIVKVKSGRLALNKSIASGISVVEALPSHFNNEEKAIN